MLDASVLQAVSDQRLFEVHDGLHVLAADEDVTKAFDVVAAEMAHRSLVFTPLAKGGDLPGHPFRGNQHTSGKGGKGEPEEAGMDSPAGQAARAGQSFKRDKAPGKAEESEEAGMDSSAAQSARAGWAVKPMSPSVAPSPKKGFTDHLTSILDHVTSLLGGDTGIGPDLYPRVHGNIAKSWWLRDELRAVSKKGKPPDPRAAKPVAKRDYSVEERRAMAESGQAMADGSHPIGNEADLHHSVRVVGQSADPQAAMQHIIERAKAMGMENSLPEGWTQPEKDAKAKAEPPAPGAHSMAGPEPAKPATAAKKEFDFEGTILNMDDGYSYAVIKASDEKRLTVGPVYMPDTLDAHGEWASADDLEAATIAYVKSGDRTVYLQHSEMPAGEWVSIMPWPQEVTAHMTVIDNGVRKAADTTFPAGTVYMGIEWEPWSWSEIKEGRIGGLSMGGTARRREGVPA